MPRIYAFAPIGYGPVDIASIAPAPAEFEAVALELGDGVNPLPVKPGACQKEAHNAGHDKAGASMRTLNIEPMFPGDIKYTDLRCTICYPGDMRCNQNLSDV